MNTSIELPFEGGSKFYNLPTDILLYIFSKSNLKELLNFKKTCRKFYKLIDNNYIHMKKTMIFEMSITRSTMDNDKIFFNFDVCYVNYNKNNKSTNGKYYKKDIKDEEEFCKILKIFNTKNLYRFVIRNCDNINIFNILYKYYQQDSNIEILYIDKLGDNDIKSFQLFMSQLKNIKILEVLQISSSIKIPKTKPSFNFPSITSLECINLTECHNTDFLNLKLVIDLFENNFNLKDLHLSSTNNYFIESILIWFFFKQQLSTSKRCNHNKISLWLDNISNYKFKLTRTLNTILSYLQGILEYQMFYTFKGHTKYEIVKRCIYCNEESIDMHVTLINSTKKIK